MRMIAVTYVYMINKYIELLDTIFMVFKKKNNQVRVYSGKNIRCFFENNTLLYIIVI